MTSTSTGTASPRTLGGVATAIAVLVAALVVTSAIGFYPAYFSQFPEFSGSGWEVHFHLLTVVAWLVLLATQAWSGATGRIERHRILGRSSYVLVPLIIIGFALVARYGQERQPNPALIGAALFDGGLFLLFYLLALWSRRNTAHHARYMLLTAVAFINAPLGRATAPELSVPLEFLVIVALLVTARMRGQAWRPFLVGAIAYVVLLGAIMIVSPPG